MLIIPSIHAIERCESDAVAVSMTILITAATIRILIVKSSRAAQTSSQYPFGIDSGFLLLPKAKSL